MPKPGEHKTVQARILRKVRTTDCADLCISKMMEAQMKPCDQRHQCNLWLRALLHQLMTGQMRVNEAADITGL